MLAIQDRVVAPAESLAAAVGDEILEQPRGFLFLVVKRVGAHFVRRFLVGGQLLLEQLRVLRQHATRGLEDLPRAAAILVEDDRLDFVVPLEPHQDVRVRARPGEDRLLVVTDCEEVAMRCGELVQQVVLDCVDVLKFVHEQIVKPVRDPVGERRGFGDQLVEVDHVAMGEPGAVLAEQPGFVRLELVTLQPVPAEAVEDAAAPLGRHAQPAEDDALVQVVRDAEAFLQARCLDVVAQQR